MIMRIEEDRIKGKGLLPLFVRMRKSVSSSLPLESDLVSTWLEVEVTSLVVSLPRLCVDHYWRHARLEALRLATDLLQRRHRFKR